MKKTVDSLYKCSESIIGMNWETTERTTVASHSWPTTHLKSLPMNKMYSDLTNRVFLILYHFAFFFKQYPQCRKAVLSQIMQCCGPVFIISTLFMQNYDFSIILAWQTTPTTNPWPPLLWSHVETLKSFKLVEWMFVDRIHIFLMQLFIVWTDISTGRVSCLWMEKMNSYSQNKGHQK